MPDASAAQSRCRSATALVGPPSLVRRMDHSEVLQISPSLNPALACSSLRSEWISRCCLLLHSRSRELKPLQICPSPLHRTRAPVLRLHTILTSSPFDGRWCLEGLRVEGMPCAGSLCSLRSQPLCGLQPTQLCAHSGARVGGSGGVGEWTRAISGVRELVRDAALFCAASLSAAHRSHQGSSAAPPQRHPLLCPARGPPLMPLR